MNQETSPRRADGRQFLELRPLRITAGVNPYADGSAEAQLGATRLLISAELLRGGEAGRRVEVEVGILPCATHIRERTEEVRRAEAHELEIIRSLAADALQASLAHAALGDLCVRMYCTIICSDGGVAGACVAAGWVALFEALRRAANQQWIDEDLDVIRMVGISGGMVNGVPLLDLTSSEAGQASFRTVLVFNSHKQLVKMQAAQEESAADITELQKLLAAAGEAIGPILQEQERAALALT